MSEKPRSMPYRVEVPMAPDALPQEVRLAYLRERDRCQKLSDEIVILEFERETLGRQLQDKEMQLQRASIEYEVRIQEMKKRKGESKLSTELQELKNELSKLKSTEVESAKKKMEEALEKMAQELKDFRKSLPIRTLLQAKEAELRRVKKFVESIPRKHPDRSGAEALLKDHIVERDEILAVCERIDHQFTAQLEKMRILAEEPLV